MSKILYMFLGMLLITLIVSVVIQWSLGCYHMCSIPPDCLFYANIMFLTSIGVLITLLVNGLYNLFNK